MAFFHAPAASTSPIPSPCRHGTCLGKQPSTDGRPHALWRHVYATGQENAEFSRNHQNSLNAFFRSLIRRTEGRGRGPEWGLHGPAGKVKGHETVVRRKCRRKRPGSAAVSGARSSVWEAHHSFPSRLWSTCGDFRENDRSPDFHININPNPSALMREEVVRMAAFQHSRWQ